MQVARSVRGKKKCVTVVVGLRTFGKVNMLFTMAMS